MTDKPGSLYKRWIHYPVFWQKVTLLPKHWHRHAQKLRQSTGCMQVRMWTGIHGIFMIWYWIAESVSDEKLLIFIPNFLLLNVLKAMGNFYFSCW